MKKLNSLLFVVGLALGCCLIWKIGLVRLWQELAVLGWGLVPFILTEGAGEMIHTLGWRTCLNEPYRRMPLAVLFQIRMSGYAVNYLTPSATLGGEVTKSALLVSHAPGAGAVSGVLIDKVCLALAHVLCVTFGSLFLLWNVHLPAPLWFSMMISGAIVSTGVVTFLVLQKQGRVGVLIRWLAAHRIGGQMILNAAAHVTRVDDALSQFYKQRRWDLCRNVGWHVIAFLIGIAQIQFFLALLAPGTSFMTAATIWLLCLWFDLLTFAVPLNAGSQEGSRVIAFQAVGFGSVLGITYGVALRLAQLFWAAVGVIFYGIRASSNVRAQACVADA